MVLERSVKPSELKKLQDDYSVDMAPEGIEERRRGLMVIKKSSLPSKADKRRTAILNWQVWVIILAGLIYGKRLKIRGTVNIDYGSAFVTYGKITETKSSRKEPSFLAEVP